MSSKLEFSGQQFDLHIAARGANLSCVVDGKTYEVSEAPANGASFSVLTVDGRSYRIWRVIDGDRVHLKMDGRTFSVSYQEPVSAAQHASFSADEICAEMPGVVVTLMQSAGAKVSKGETVLTIESMKMQMNIDAPRDGVIDKIHVNENDAFEKAALLVSLKPLEA